MEETNVLKSISYFLSGTKKKKPVFKGIYHAFVRIRDHLFPCVFLEVSFSPNWEDLWDIVDIFLVHFCKSFGTWYGVWLMLFCFPFRKSRFWKIFQRRYFWFCKLTGFPNLRKYKKFLEIYKKFLTLNSLLKRVMLEKD